MRLKHHENDFPMWLKKPPVTSGERKPSNMPGFDCRTTLIQQFLSGIHPHAILSVLLILYFYLKMYEVKFV